MINLNSILKKQRHYFADKGPSSQTYGFSSSHVLMWELDCKENWDTECQRFDAFELWCWRRLLRVPWTARRSNQSILKELSTEYPLEELMLKLKLQYFGHLMYQTDSCERSWCWERLKVGGEWDERRWDGWIASPTQWTRVWARSGSWWWTAVHEVAKSWTPLSNWTELIQSTFWIALRYVSEDIKQIPATL